VDIGKLRHAEGAEVFGTNKVYPGVIVEHRRHIIWMFVTPKALMAVQGMLDAG
jgi:hypothetical protein